MSGSLLSKAGIDGLKERVAATSAALHGMRARRSRRKRHVIYAADEPPSFLARWSSRLAVFAAFTLLVTLVLHRVLSLPTPVALAIAAGVFAAAALVLVMNAIAGLEIWITGRRGAARVIFGSVVALALLAIPGSAALLSRHYPDINDVTTDTAEPPEFTEGAKARGAAGGLWANPVGYAGAAFAAQQAAAYPDLKSLVVPRPVPQAYELVLQALAKQKHKVLFEVPPEEETGAPGFVEFSERTMILGFTDDVVIRVLAAGEGARIDVRSASRYGRNDFGANAERVRSILKEVVGRFEVSVPTADGGAKTGDGKVTLKSRKDRNPGAAPSRTRPDPSRSNTQREPRRKAAPQE